MAEAACSRWWELFAVTAINCTTADVEWGTVRDVTDIHIDGLVKTFGSTRAVDGISLTVNSGEMFFLVGPSGCGKTTLLRMLAGFSTPDSGQIRFGTEDVTSLAPNQRDIGMVFQGYALWPHMTVAENISFGLKMRKVPKEEIEHRVSEIIEMTGLAGMGDRKPNALSGGQQQRVALARALVIRPNLLLLDEPLSNLDAKLRIEMRREIRRICKQSGTTAIYVTHDQDEALSMSDRMAVLSAGQVQQCDTPVNSYRKPASKFVAEFLGEANLVLAELVDLDDQFARVRLAADRPMFHVEHALSPSQARPGAAVPLMIRPADLHPVLVESDANPSGDADLIPLGHARVLDSQFFGATTSLAVEGEFPLEGILRIQTSAQGVEFKDGDRVALYSSQSAMWVLPQETSG
jgi:ABC-type Fe3+/spermidine/putrescine transport system ATPase subunit